MAEKGVEEQVLAMERLLNITVSLPDWRKFDPKNATDLFRSVALLLILSCSDFVH